ncbi:MAG: PorV/PorQ family protein [FCB group bacterium]|nr:PorV/PorQ family protein [FCB group bacterium]
MKQVHILLILTAIILMGMVQTAEATSEAAVLYLRVAPGARPAGMGEAFVSIADDATATYWNPAGLGNEPMAGTLKTRKLAPAFGMITDVVTLKGASGGNETWVIADNKLLMFDGKHWNAGRDFETSSDQTLFDFLKTIFNTEDDEQLIKMGEQVREVSCPVTAEEVDAFIAKVKSVVTEDYASRDDLLADLDNFKDGFDGCLLNPNQFYNLQNKIAEGLVDSIVTSEELDRITFSLDRAIYRFLPSHLTVPYSVGIDGNLTCLGGTSRYLWVGTDEGLFRRANRIWARFGADMLPSTVVTTIAGYDDHLMIGTEMGLVSYYHGAFAEFSDLPQAPVEAVTYVSAKTVYAVVGGVVYYYNDNRWSDSYKYVVRLDDTMEKLATRAGIYHTDTEYSALEKRIRDMNAIITAPTQSNESAVQISPEAAASAEETAEADTGSGEAVVEDKTDVSMSGEEPALEVEPIPVEEPTTTTVYLSDEQWLIEGKVIQLPYSPTMRYKVTALAYDLSGGLWIGTTGGLLSFDGSLWARYGYSEYVNRSVDSSGAAVSMTAEEIARNQLSDDDPDLVAILAANIDSYNELNGRPVAPGRKVYVYNSNLGSPIYSIGVNLGELFVGTEYGLLKFTSEGWRQVNEERLNRRQVVGTYDYAGQSYFISNNAVTIESKGAHEVVLMHVNWLPTLGLDMYYEFLSYVHNVRGLGTMGLSFIYLNYGQIDFRDAEGASIGSEDPFELTTALSFGTSLSDNIKTGLTVKFIYSHLSSVGAGEERGNGVASAFAFDVGVLVKLSDRLQFGSALTNIGPEITYVDADQNDPLPRNLAVGFSYKLVNSQYNRLIAQIEVNRMLTNLNHGFSKELDYAIKHVGAEYLYSNLIALRVGYKYDKEGDVKHLTFGAGLELKGARLDFAYVPSSEDSPLSNTLRISGTVNF